MRPDISAWNPVHTTVRPNPEHTERYGEFYRHYRELYPSTVDTMHFLAAQQHAAAAAR